MFSYWSKFHVNIITDSGVRAIFVYKGLTRNTEIRNTPVWVLSNIWRLGWVKGSKFGTNVSNKKLMSEIMSEGLIKQEAIIILHLAFAKWLKIFWHTHIQNFVGGNMSWSQSTLKNDYI